MEVVCEGMGSLLGFQGLRPKNLLLVLTNEEVKGGGDIDEGQRTEGDADWGQRDRSVE